MASAFSRRTALATAAVASSLPLTTKAATKRSKIDFTKPEDSLYAVTMVHRHLELGGARQTAQARLPLSGYYPHQLGAAARRKLFLPHV